MSRKEFLLLILFFLVIFFSSLFPIRFSHWWDEAVYLQNAEVIFSGRTNYDEFSFRPPLLSIIFCLTFLFWYSEVAASIVTTALAASGPIFIYLSGKKLYDVETGLIASIAVGFSPFFIENSNFLLTDVPALSLASISFYFLIRDDYLQSKLLSGLILSLAVLMKFTNILLVPLFFLYCFFKKLDFKSASFYSLGFLIGIFPYLLWAQLSFGSFIFPFTEGMRMVGEYNENAFFYFLNLTEAFTVFVPLGFLLFGFVVLDKIKNGKSNSLKQDFFLICWLSIFLFYLSIVVSHKELRYIFPIALPLSLISAQGFSFFLKKIQIRRIRFLLIFIFLLIFVFYLIPSVFKHGLENFHFFYDELFDEIRMSYLISETLSYDDVVYSNHNWPVFAYYSNRSVKAVPYDDSFFLHYKSIMDKPGFIVITDNVNKPPSIEWLNNSSEFVFLKRINNLHLYKYNI